MDYLPPEAFLESCLVVIFFFVEAGDEYVTIDLVVLVEGGRVWLCFDSFVGGLLGEVLLASLLAVEE